jgi:hypothetical protein
MKMPHICVPNLISMGLMTNRDFQNYSSWIDGVNVKDWFINLFEAPFQFSGQIHKRASMSPHIDYLSRLNERYEAWVDTYDRGKYLS